MTGFGDCKFNILLAARPWGRLTMPSSSSSSPALDCEEIRGSWASFAGDLVECCSSSSSLSFMKGFAAAGLMVNVEVLLGGEGVGALSISASIFATLARGLR